MTDAASALATALEAEHRELDSLLGRFFAAAGVGNSDAALRAIETFDQRLREHTRREEERLYAAPREGKLGATESDTELERVSRELRLEHVQIRELSGMMRRQLTENRDLASARALAVNLARRWDAHTSWEEHSIFPTLGNAIGDGV